MRSLVTFSSLSIANAGENDRIASILATKEKVVRVEEAESISNGQENDDA